MLEYRQDMEEIMTKTKLVYKLNAKKLSSCTIFGKDRMNVNAVKAFNVNNNKKVKEDDFGIEM